MRRQIAALERQERQEQLERNSQGEYEASAEQVLESPEISPMVLYGDLRPTRFQKVPRKRMFVHHLPATSSGSMLSPAFTVSASGQKSTEATARVTFGQSIPGFGHYESALEMGSEDESLGTSPPRKQLLSKQAHSSSVGFHAPAEEVQMHRIPEEEWAAAAL